tara:strand:+ start:541 stop:2130 length:1590 start_codon:yes stop_codon:yes gene_type:complete
LVNQINIKNLVQKFLIFKRKSKFALVLYFLCSFFIVDISKAENDNLVSESEPLINLEYLESKNELEDYIVDTGDSLLINFINQPRGLDMTKNENFTPDDISYLIPRSNLEKYYLDEGDELLLEFPKTPELNGVFTIDSEGEIYLPQLKTVYVRGLNKLQLMNLLETRYKEYLIEPELNIRIVGFRFINSGVYDVNNEGEIFLPLLEETYVRGLTTNEISSLLSKKFRSSEFISTKVNTRVVGFKPQRILVSGEIRAPGIYEFSGYDSADFEKINPAKKRMESESQERFAADMNKFDTKNNELSKDENVQNNNLLATLQIKKPSENFTTISNAILRAGGITSLTDLSRIEIIRDVPLSKGGGKKRAFIDFSSFLNESDVSNDIRLFDGDRLIFSKLTSRDPDQIAKSILSGVSPKFISVELFGRVENPGIVKLPLEASLSDAIDLTGPIKPLSGKIVLIRYEKDGTVLKKNISYSSTAKRGSRRNPYLMENDLITVKNSFIGKVNGVLREVTSPFIGIYSTKEIIESFSD